MAKSYIFSSESVTEGHPDKVADTISDAVLDACLAQDKHSRVACETMVKSNLVVVAGEITTKADFDYNKVVRNAIREIGYTDKGESFNADGVHIMNALIKDLNKQRNQIQQDAIAEKQHALDDLANSIATNHGRLDGAPVTVSNSDAPQLQPVEAAPGADQPSGPIAASAFANGAPGSNSATDSAFKQKLLGYWKSPRHAYFYSKDGSMQMVGGDPKNKWDIVNGVYHEVEDDGRDYAYDIVTLTDNKFVYRSRDANPMTFTLSRISKREAEEY